MNAPHWKCADVPRDEGNVLDSIVGRQLSSVEFVQNYVQLRFDGPTLTAFAPPDVEAETEVHRWGDCSYRNALCDCITKVVRSTTVKEKDSLQVAFVDGTRLRISLRPEQAARGLAEAAMFSDGDGRWEAWQL